MGRPKKVYAKAPPPPPLPKGAKVAPAWASDPNRQFSDEELISYGTEMIDWCEKNRPLHLSFWYTCEKWITYNHWKSMIQRPVFLPYYERAIRMVSENCLDGTINAGISHRFIRIYFRDVRDGEDKDLDDKVEREVKKRVKEIEAEYRLKSEVLNAVAPDIANKFDAIMDQFTLQQSALKTSKTSPAKVNKSS